ncbi:cobalamin-binding protein [Flavobacteriales bacterium 33_180_T64]|nr:cobalamin-binding protein [Flavobacteriales bacterium 33_180_T64]
MICKDQLNRVIHIDDTPKRIVSLVPSQTELLVDLGLESSIVGITKFCIHPKYLRKEKTVVGGTKQVSFEKIKALNPDIILCNKEENTKEMLIELEDIASVHMSDIYNVKDTLALISMYGELFSVERKADLLIWDIKNQYQEFQNYIHTKPILKVAYFIWKKPWMVAAKHTFIDALLTLNNFENTFDTLERYPEVDLDIINRNVDIIMLSSEPYPFKDKDIDELRMQFLNTKIMLVDGEFFSWYGSRLKKAFKYFKTLHE